MNIVKNCPQTNYLDVHFARCKRGSKKYNVWVKSSEWFVGEVTYHELTRCWRYHPANDIQINVDILEDITSFLEDLRAKAWRL